MIDSAILRSDPDRIRESQRRRGEDVLIVDRLIEADQQSREARQRFDELRNEQKVLSKQIGPLQGKLKKADEAAKPGVAPPATADAESPGDYHRELTADSRLLFRYSALTFNAHRIHYDYQYATQTEGYPGIIVHGPLLATLMLELLSSNFPEEAIRNLEFRALGPIFGDLSLIHI